MSLQTTAMWLGGAALVGVAAWFIVGKLNPKTEFETYQEKAAELGKDGRATLVARARANPLSLTQAEAKLWGTIDPDGLGAAMGQSPEIAARLLALVNAQAYVAPESAPEALFALESVKGRVAGVDHLLRIPNFEWAHMSFDVAYLVHDRFLGPVDFRTQP